MVDFSDDDDFFTSSSLVFKQISNDEFDGSKYVNKEESSSSEGGCSSLILFYIFCNLTLFNLQIIFMKNNFCKSDFSLDFEDSIKLKNNLTSYYTHCTKEIRTIESAIIQDQTGSWLRSDKLIWHIDFNLLTDEGPLQVRGHIELIKAKKTMFHGFSISIF